MKKIVTTSAVLLSLGSTALASNPFDGLYVGVTANGSQRSIELNGTANKGGNVILDGTKTITNNLISYTLYVGFGGMLGGVPPYLGLEFGVTHNPKVTSKNISEVPGVNYQFDYKSDVDWSLSMRLGAPIMEDTMLYAHSGVRLGKVTLKAEGMKNNRSVFDLFAGVGLEHLMLDNKVMARLELLIPFKQFSKPSLRFSGNPDANFEVSRNQWMIKGGAASKFSPPPAPATPTEVPTEAAEAILQAPVPDNGLAPVKKAYADSKRYLGQVNRKLRTPVSGAIGKPGVPQGKMDTRGILKNMPKEDAPPAPVDLG